MTASDIGSIASAVVALAALIVAVVSLRKTNKFGETTDRLNRLLIERETAEGVASKKADLSANMIKVGKNDHRLKVFNRGKGVGPVVLDLLCDIVNGNASGARQAGVDRFGVKPDLTQGGADVCCQCNRRGD